MASMSDAIELTKVERMELERRAASRTGRAEDARRARLILLLAEGHSWDEACERVPCSRGFVASWTRRFDEQRLAGLYSRHLGQVAPVLTLSPGRLERHGFEYYRHGTLSLYAAFNTKTGEVLGKTAVRHTSAEFVAFLTELVLNQPRGKEIHVIADNLSTHKTPQVQEFLAAHPNVHLHFTPTYSSCLNQVELWCGKIERDVIARGIFTSVFDLKRKLMRYIRQYNKAPRTVKWKYADPSRHLGIGSVVTGH